MAMVRFLSFSRGARDGKGVRDLPSQASGATVSKVYCEEGWANLDEPSGAMCLHEIPPEEWQRAHWKEDDVRLTGSGWRVGRVHNFYCDCSPSVAAA